MSTFRQGFDTGYELAVRHAIEYVEGMRGLVSYDELPQAMRDFYKSDLEAEERRRKESTAPKPPAPSRKAGNDEPQTAAKRPKA
jgi:hypothetical protein